MAKAKEVIRNYKISDDEMIQTSRVFLGLYIEDKRFFISVDAIFGTSYQENWTTAIEAAETAAKDLTVQDELALLTAAVQQKMEACRTHFQKMKYNIEKAFPDNNAVWNAFGYSDYVVARKSEIKLIPFMKNLHTQAVKYSVNLIAAGYTQENIDMIATLREELMNADQAQENYKKDRLIITQNRIKALNTTWEYALKINKASKNIFVNDYAKLKQYLLPGEPTPEQPADSSPAPQNPPS